MNNNFEYVQIIRSDLIIDHAKDRFPHLWAEVLQHNKISESNWYTLSTEAWEEFRAFSREYPV
jgi:hypothetical protein